MQKEQSVVGYAKFEWTDYKINIFIKVQNIRHSGNDYDIRIEDYKQNLLVMLPPIHIKEGIGILNQSFNRNQIQLLKECIMELGQVRICLDKDVEIKGCFHNYFYQKNDKKKKEPIESSLDYNEKDNQEDYMPDKKEYENLENLIEEKVSENIKQNSEKIKKELDNRSERKEESQAVPIDQWEELKQRYPNIQPYGDHRTYITLTINELNILESEYQILQNNSFLLHGYYYYKYLILGKEKDFYLGVPGIYHEREKMMALMFGFEAFDCAGGNPAQGTFGYYLKKVALLNNQTP